jgi:bacillithiol biosynthesis deacetylase BshB1
MKLDILVFAAHPDDAELSCSGTIIKHIKLGKKVGIVDLTRGEMGTRGTAEIRDEESKAASKILGIHVRENLEMEDGFFELSKENQLKVIQMIRKYQPEVILANAIEDRHPDHGRAAKLIQEVHFKSGLTKVRTSYDGIEQKAWRAKKVFHYIQDRLLKPDFVVDITEEMDQKMESVRAFKSQFYDPNSAEPSTYISSPDFYEAIISRCREMGKLSKGTYAEGFTVIKTIEVDNLDSIF